MSRDHPVHLGLYLGLLCVVAFVPLVFWPYLHNIVLPKLVVAQGGIFTLFGVWLAYQVGRDDWRLPRTGLNALLVLWLGWNLFSIMAWSDFWHFGLKEAGPLLACILGFFLIVETTTSWNRIKGLAYTLLSLCILILALGFMQHVGVSLIDWGRDVLISTLGNRNFLAGYLVLLLPVLVGLAFMERHPGLRILVLAVVGAQFYMILLTENRTSVLAVGAAAVVFVALTLWSGSFNFRKRTYLIVGGILTVVASVSLIWFVPQGFWENMMAAFDLQQGTARVRWIMWTGSAWAALDALIGGHGFGVFQLVFPFYRPSFYHRFRVSHNTRHSHNEFLELLMESGLVGLALFLLIMVTLLVIAMRYLRSNPGVRARFLTIGVMAALAGGLVENMASVNLRWMATMFQFWILAGFLVAIIRVDTGKEPNPNPRGTSDTEEGAENPDPLLIGYRLGIGLVVVGAWFGLYSLVQADLSFQQMNREVRRAEMMRGRSTQAWSQAIEHGRQALEANPYHLSVQYKLGFVQLQQGSLPEAFQTYDRLQRLAPNYAQIHQNLASVNRQLGRPGWGLIHEEWAVDREDNRSNRLNLSGAYLLENLNQEPLRHLSSMVHLYEEDRRDKLHLVHHNLDERSFGGVQNRFGDVRQLDSGVPNIRLFKRKNRAERVEQLLNPSEAGLLPIDGPLADRNPEYLETLRTRLYNSPAGPVSE